ncbi:erythromycin esterase family protein [Sporosarcina thermotolerans]|uniref:Erythromycin esterase family protein n=1 Tax=Sporosarcina thermotolerans TaxID=633404 RepID=A0AAW9AFE7_9BACL|nr:erythromycin esterase family protein [Sporosarcina thermotolerans]MDW0118849.1 erythromycin esterase family protein [Sporosarcina thermotolerans]WHT48458.1 erythromycin esterase family protein [Sporosarcina thermotolerans]
MSKKLIAAIQEHAFTLDEKAFDTIMNAIGDARIVMLGEASHGTSEFYKVRAALSKRLIQEKGFKIIAVEGDWPSAQAVNRYVKGFDEEGKTARQVLSQSFNRWPTWMWANEEVAELIEWLKRENEGKDAADKTGFYGIDMYSLYESIDEVLQFLQENPTYNADLEMARRAFSCFEPYNRMPEHYALSTLHFSDECIREVTNLLTTIRSHEDLYSNDQEKDLNITMNALVAKNAESYYRAMMQDDAISWNIRDMHMVEAVGELLNYHGDDAKIIIWEHNTHVGDASETSMADHDMINVGQLIREKYGRDDTFAIGFGTYEGTVIAGEGWGEPLQKMKVPPAKFNSWEGQMHAAAEVDQVILFTEENRHLFNEWIGHRAIGVVYNPEFEAYGNYVSSRVGSRYDGFIFVDQTTALTPINSND